MPTINIKDIPESKMVKLVDLSEDSINKIAEAVVRKIIVNTVKEQSTVTKLSTVDVTKVVRCKDCKFYYEDEKWCERLGLCGAFNKNDFCSHGERKNGTD